MLVLDRLEKRFEGKQVLRGLTLAVRPGELFGLCGANGSGKTTVMRIVLGVTTADAGEVRWNGAPMDAAARRRIGYMPEDRGLYLKQRPLDQLVYFAMLSGVPQEEAERRAREWLEGLEVKAAANDKLEDLSLGNQQKVQLIAAVIHDPELLILDEPFSGLDLHAVDAMVEVLRAFAAGGIPVLFSSHQLDLVERLCDRVAIIRDGAQVAVGTVAELRESLQQEGPSGWTLAEVYRELSR
ncbi:ABC-2 type transport system ATP-binding protein [Thermocatellispora tengchongensis]|uniref:ABC-2 type transport system ATP-binding protein n=1 Tax=Thermocatellispora tengchongensis TaxID=1073253 RepID=A0A840PQD0_9ACTN|nr:ATP-binding cassette domain-containing protein [Thermocatellispora tengchongensis]MBB5139287.1 ABC-2 type transport system ATP-binding protein [Thermocatellispora tengchongensis]